MVKEIENIKNIILEKNPYFANGFSTVTRNPDKGLVLKGDVAVFPSDTFGNYFYLRLPQNITFDNNAYYLIADSLGGFGGVAQVVLVACVAKADPDKLLNSLVNSLRPLCDTSLIFNSYVFIKEEVVRSELQFMETEARDKALANLPSDLTIVSLTFTISEPIPHNCIEDPCSC